MLCKGVGTVGMYAGCLPPSKRSALALGTEREKAGCVCRMTSLTSSWTMTVQPQALLKRRLQLLRWTARHSPSSSRHSRHSSTWYRGHTGMCAPGWSSLVRRHPDQRMPCWRRTSRASSREWLLPRQCSRRQDLQGLQSSGLIPSTTMSRRKVYLEGRSHSSSFTTSVVS